MDKWHREYDLEVSSKHEVANSYYVRLTPDFSDYEQLSYPGWILRTPEGMPVDLTVSKEEYDLVRIGDTIRITLDLRLSFDRLAEIANDG